MARIELRGEASELLLYGTEIGVTSAVASPPGARVEAVAIADDEARSPFRIKVHRCKRQPDGTFVIVGVTIDLRREGRAVLEHMGSAARGLPKGV
jgi:hypothetical protein